jgi:DNA-directed RNA polymerase subunit F
MIYMKVIESKPVGMPEAKMIMSSREEDSELSYEQKLAVEHLNKFTKLDSEESKKFIEEISQVLRMSPETTVKILDLLPQTPDELRMIFAREKFSLKEDEINKILEITRKYSK